MTTSSFPIADPPPTPALPPALSDNLNLWFALHQLGRAGHWHVSFTGAKRTLCGASVISTQKTIRTPPPTCPNCIKVLHRWAKDYYQ